LQTGFVGGIEQIAEDIGWKMLPSAIDTVPVV
jgi:hypothetical protein